MRLAAALTLALLASPAAARDLAGRYRVTEGPDVAGRLELRGDGRFGYEFAAGALDERAQGRWVQRGDPGHERACLTTAPKPVAPVLQPGPVPADQAATVRVTWAKSDRGIPGVDFVIGFDSGEPVTGYTQEDGWTLPQDERRTPRWIELMEPIYRVPLARTAFPASGPSAGKFRAVLVPNDIGVVDFQDACLEQARTGNEEGYVLHRAEGDMRFAAERR
ncbi:MAG: putative secreted protein [Novosphingobium sp.]|nr:putative secreted protein [Novosphingobium sp.]